MSRTSVYPIERMFLERWSPRAFSAEAMPRETLLTMLEAARWAASSYNSQPWRFIYALRGTAVWDDLLGLLVPFNREWAQHAAALVFAVSKTTAASPRTGDEHPLPTHSFDTGAACACMVLQAQSMGWYCHGMVGFDGERARTVLAVPAELALEAVFAIGRLGDPSQLSEALRGREGPSDRMLLEQLVFEGRVGSMTGR